MDKEKIIEIVEKSIESIDTTKCRRLSVVKDLCQEKAEYPNYHIICIAGGLNGRGIWSNYFEILAKLMFQIELYFNERPFVLNVENDVADDVFYLFIGIHK